MRSLFSNKYWILAIMTILFVMFFTAFMEIAQMFLPFYAVYGILKIRDKRKAKLQG